MNKKKEPILILGAGGHGRVVVDVLRSLGYRNFVLRDDLLSLHGQYVWGSDYPKVMAPITLEILREDAAERAVWFGVGVGSINGQGCERRERIFNMAELAGLKPINAISPTAVVFGEITFGESGVFIGPKAVVMSGAWVDRNVIINTGAIVEHGCKIGRSSHIATGAVLCGGVQVGDRVHIGAGAVVKQGVSIGYGATVGLGSVVLNDVDMGVTVVGNPAQDIEKLKAAIRKVEKLG